MYITFIGLGNVNLIQKELLVHFLTTCSGCSVADYLESQPSDPLRLGKEVGPQFQLRIVQGHLFSFPTSWQMRRRYRIHA